MSYDLGVWYGDSAMTREEAAAFYRHINADWVVVRRHAAFDAFWAELLAQFPNLGHAAAAPDEPPGSMLQTMDDIRRLPPPTAPRGGEVRWGGGISVMGSNSRSTPTSS